MKSLALVMLAFTLPILACGAYVAASSGGGFTCHRWHVIPVHGEYLLENNVWGDRSAHVCMFDNGHEFGWFWDKQFPTKHPIYPEVIYGWKPWRDHSTTENLPRRIAEIQSIVVEANYTTLAEGYSWHNVLIDVWITKSDHPTPDGITDEIGIYLETHGIWVERQKNKSLKDGYELIEINGTQFIYVERKAFKWRFHKFYLVGERPEKLDIMTFIKYLNLSEDLYVTSVEFGNEVWMGKGLTIVRDYQVEVVLDDAQA